MEVGFGIVGGSTVTDGCQGLASADAGALAGNYAVRGEVRVEISVAVVAKDRESGTQAFGIASRALTDVSDDTVGDGNYCTAWAGKKVGGVFFAGFAMVVTEGWSAISGAWSGI